LYSFIKIIFIFLLPYIAQATPIPTKNIEKVIHDSYTKKYPTIEIESIRVKQIGKTPRNFDTFKEQEIVLPKPALKRDKSTISVLYSTPKKDKKIYFKYQIKAKISIYKATNLIPRETPLTLENLHLEKIPFTNIISQPIGKDDLNRYSAKRAIKKNRIITILDIKKSLDIIKNQHVNATIVDEDLKITFQAKALQSGFIGDIIKIKRGKKKIFRAKIVSKNRVEVID